MAQFANFLSVPTEQPDYSGYSNLFKNMLSGYKMAAEPERMQEDLRAKQFANQIAAYQSSPENIEMDKQLKMAQLNRANAPAQGPAPTELAKIMAERNATPEGSPERQAYDDFIKKKTSQSNGVTVFDPNNPNSPLVQIGGGSEAGVSKTGSLPAGWQYSYATDEKGNKVPDAVLVPPDANRINELQGRSIFQEVYPAVNNIASYYSGKDSWTKFKSDLDNINTDPEAKNRIVDYYTAMKLLPALTVKEQATLKASGTLGMFKALEKKMNSSDIPKALESYAGFTMPADVMQLSGNNMMNILTKSTENAAKVIPAYERRPLNLEASGDKEKKELQSSGEMVKVKAPNGKVYNIPSNQVESALASGGKLYGK